MKKGAFETGYPLHPIPLSCHLGRYNHHMPTPTPVTQSPAIGWAIYSRVSTDEQAANGASLDAQERQCRNRLEAEGYPLAGIYRDAGVSAKDLRRPALLRLMDDVEGKRIGGIVVQKLDRLSRNVQDFLTTTARLNELHVDLISVQEKIDTSGPGGRFVLIVLMALAQLEREQTGERVKSVIRHKKSLGEFCGGPIPAGLRSIGPAGHRTLEVDPVHGPKVALCWSMVATGATLLEVAGFLSREGVPTGKKGSRWQKANVGRFLARPAYVGRLVDQESFDRCREALGRRYAPTFGHREGNRAACHPRTERVWLLQGVARCARCGSALVGSCHGRRQLPYLRCAGRAKHGVSHCDASNIPAVAYERAVIDALILEIGSGTELAQALTDMMAERRARAAPELKRRGALEIERDDLRRRIEEVIDLKLAGGLSKAATVERLETLQRLVNKVDADLLELDGTAASIQAGQLGVDLLMANLRTMIGGLREAPPEKQREVILGLVREARIARKQSITLTLAIPGTLKKAHPPAKPVGGLVSTGEAGEMLSAATTGRHRLMR